MVDRPRTHGQDVGVVRDMRAQTDRSMDALQYALAFLAIITAFLLTLLR